MLSTLRPTRTLLPPLLGLVLSVVAAACGDTTDPVAPAISDEAAALVPAATSSPTGALGASGRIIFNSARNGGYDIYKMDATGGNVAALTKNAYAGEPAWSRDNTRIAMVRERVDAANKSHTDIWVIDANGSNGHWARSSPLPYDLRYPSWSPDGSRILLTITQLGKPYLATLTLATGVIKFVTWNGSGVQGNYPTYDGSGNRILFVSASGRSLQQIKTNGTDRTVVASFANTLSSPKYSPDGGRIAFEMLVGLNIDLYLWDIGKQVTTRLTTHSAIDEQATWSPDGSTIAFMSLRTGQPQIYTMPASGGNQTRITDTRTAEKDPAWSF